MDIFKVYWFHNKHLFDCHYQTIMLKCCLSLIILWRIDKHYMFMLRWDDDQWPQCLPPSDTSHSPRSNGSVPSLRQPQAAARISQDWLTGNEHARLDNADILGEISSSGYWELLDFMQFIGVSIWCVLKTSLKRTQSPGRQCVFWWESDYYLRVWHSDK